MPTSNKPRGDWQPNDSQMAVIRLAVDRGPVELRNAAEFAAIPWPEFEGIAQELRRRGLLRFACADEWTPVSLCATAAGRRLLALRGDK